MPWVGIVAVGCAAIVVTVLTIAVAAFLRPVRTRDLGAVSTTWLAQHHGGQHSVDSE
jgi:hypothetical protein